MATLLTKPALTCSSCGSSFTYDASDIRSYSEQYWAGYFKGGWDTRIKRYVECPGCKNHIYLK